MLLQAARRLPVSYSTGAPDATTYPYGAATCTCKGRMPLPPQSRLSQALHPCRELEQLKLLNLLDL
jgi:hypothetical protein